MFQESLGEQYTVTFHSEIWLDVVGGVSCVILLILRPFI